MVHHLLKVNDPKLYKRHGHYISMPYQYSSASSIMPGKTINPLVVGRVIGDVLDPFTSSISMRVLYNNNKEVINSGEFKPSQIINQPRVDIGGDDLRTLYTLVFVQQLILVHLLHSF